MKRLIPLILALAFLFSSCGTKYDHNADENIISQIKSSFDFFDGDTAYSATFRLNVLLEDSRETFMFAQGNYDVSPPAPGEKTQSVSSVLAQTLLGAPYGVKAEYKNGVLSTTIDGSVTNESLDEKDFFTQIIYVKPFLPENTNIYIKGIDDLVTASGKGYAVFLKNAGEILFPLIGEDIYTLATFKNPKRGDMAVTDAKMTFVFDGGELSGMTVIFTLTLYDTPPYVPNGGGVDKDDYKLTLLVDYSVLFNR